MQFILLGFRPDMGFRVFLFEGIANDRTRTVFRIRADLALARKHGIRVQELPLLCREYLEGREEGEEKHAFTFSEADMCLHENTLQAAKDAAAQRKKPPRRPPTTNLGAGWRTPKSF